MYLGKDEASPALPQQGKGSKGGRALALQILDVTNRNELYGLALYVAFSGLYALLLRPCAQDQIPGSKEEKKTRKLICSFHSLLPSACIYDSRLTLLLLHDRIQCAAIWYDTILQ
jgi:hypothetical protein